jgi:hypothetical protein
MKFLVLPLHGKVPTSARNTAFLITDNWNDWHKYRTLFQLQYVDETGEKHSIGEVKIGTRGMVPQDESPDLPSSFEALDESFFSLGQDDRYYEALNKLGEEKRGFAGHGSEGKEELSAGPVELEQALVENIATHEGIEVRQRDC